MAATAAQHKIKEAKRKLAEKPPFYKRPLFWILGGLGTVVGGAALFQKYYATPQQLAIGCIEHLKDKNSERCQWALQFIRTFGSGQAEFRYELSLRGAVPLLMDIVHELGEKDPPTALAAIDALGILATDQFCCVKKMRPERDLLPLMIKMSMQSHKDIPEFGGTVWFTIRKMVRDEGLREEFVRNLGLSAIIKTVHNGQKDPLSAQYASDMLASLAAEDFPSGELLASYEKKDLSEISGMLKQIGMMYSNQGLAKSAVKCFEAAHVLDSSDFQNLNLLGVEYARLGETSKASEQFEISLSWNPRQIEPVRS